MSNRLIHVGVIAPALMLPQGIEGREHEIQDIWAARDKVYQLGRAIGTGKPSTGQECVLLLGGSGGLQSACRRGFFEASGGRKTVEYYMAGSNVPDEDEECVGERIYNGSCKGDLTNYLSIIAYSDVVIFAGGFWRAIAACMMAIEHRVVLGILLGVGSAPRIIADLLSEVAPLSVKQRLIVNGNPEELIDHTTTLAWAKKLKV